MERLSPTSLNERQAELGTETETQSMVDPAETATLTSERRTAPLAMPAPEPKIEAPTPLPESGKDKLIPKRQKRKRFIFMGLGAIALGASVFGLRWWQYARTHESTDDAYITGNAHPVSSRINGTVWAVLVNDNQQVRAGQILVTLDPRDEKVQLQQVQAALEAARRQALAALSNVELASQTASGNTQQASGNVSSASAAIVTAGTAVKAAAAAVPAAQALVAQADANLRKALADYSRYQTLYAQGVVSRQDLDSYRATYYVDLAQKDAALQTVAQAQANLAQARENVTKAQAELAASQGSLQQAKATTVRTQVNRAQYQSAKAAISQSQANLNNARLQLSYTNIYAPSSGRVGNKTAQVGQRVQPGTPLMAIVENDDWVVANFKETQLEKMRHGQPVEIHIDSFPHHTFWGYVDSFSPGSGATFTVLPSDNATGNFTKIVQRIPVKIIFDPHSIKGYEGRIAPGMSVVVSVDLK